MNVKKRNMINLDSNKILFINKEEKNGLFKRNDEFIQIKQITRDDILNLSRIMYENIVSSPNGSEKQLSDYIEEFTNDNDIVDPYSAIIYKTVYESLKNIFDSVEEIKKEISDNMLKIKKLSD